jgi:hypothetical protein
MIVAVMIVMVVVVIVLSVIVIRVSIVVFVCTVVRSNTITAIVDVCVNLVIFLDVERYCCC